MMSYLNLEALPLLLCLLLGCSESTGVIPAGGTDETVVDTEPDAKANAKAQAKKKIDPNAMRLEIPRIDLGHPEVFPIQVESLIPNLRRKASVKLVGQISHPLITGVGGAVFLKFRPKIQPKMLPKGEDGKNSITHAIQGSAKAPEGKPRNEWTFEIYGQMPRDPGRYELLLMVLHGSIVPVSPDRPHEEIAPTTTVMESEVTIE